ncbi:MAG: phosphoglycerate kinase [Parcubacteria group bacterium]|nr:phosphoglycerate kinase [Parcubacteria group bacterium]MBI2049037.1 phosphoglycerate kinase [Parcubacteria group bacterium]
MELPLLTHAIDLKNKRILLRLDLNIPIEDGLLKDAYRIEAILPTLQFLKEAGVSRVVILSHHSDKKQSLKPVSRFLGKTIPHQFVPDIFADGAFVNGEEDPAIFMCENLRFWKGEEDNDPEFAGRLASQGDVYVNDAFSASHRAHASVVGLPALLPAYAGPFFAREVEELSRAWKPEHPFLLILGGAKPETKMPLVEEFLAAADSIFIGGAVANIFFRELGYEIGRSVAGKTPVNLKKILDSGKLILPGDVMVKSDDGVFVKTLQDISPDDMILDAGPETMENLKKSVGKSRFVLWNGPLGDYMKPGFEKASIVLAEAIKESPAWSIAGGGDTAALLREHHLTDAVRFVSSAGGAMLEFLGKKTLPGIEALKKVESRK